MAAQPEGRDYRPFNTETAKRGIGRTKAYELVNAGLLETFLIGTRRYIFLDSLDTLPSRLAALDGGVPAARPPRSRGPASIREVQGVASAPAIGRSPKGAAEPARGADAASR